MRHFLLLLFLSLSLVATEKPTVTVSIVPLETFVKKIAGELVELNVMVLPGHSPATYEPKPSQMRALSRSRLYFSVGVPFETVWLPRFADQNPDMKIVPTQAGLELLEMASHHHEDEGDDEHDAHDDHDHEEEDHEEHGGKDPHIWLSPANVKVMARTILTELLVLLPENKAVMTANYNRFIQDIDATDQRLRALLTPHRGSTFMVFHPTWGYLARDYGLQQLPIEMEGKEPSPARLGAFIRKAKEQKVRAIFVQPEFSQKAAKLIAKEAKVTVVSVSSLSAEWAESLLAFARAFGNKGL